MSRIADMKKAVVTRDQWCIHIKEDGTRCKKARNKNMSLCNSHLTGAPKPTPHGIYTAALDSSMTKINATITQMDLHDKLRDPDLTEELALSRMIVMELLDTQANPIQNSVRNRIKALEVVRKIAITALRMEEARSTALNAEFVESILNVIVFSFERANALTDPADRLAKFVQEMSTFFPDVNFKGNTNAEEEFDEERFADGEYVEGYVTSTA
jgi:hypothetical protein